MVSQERNDSLVKEQLPVDSLVKKLHGKDCGCTNSGDGDAGDWSASVSVGKSCGRDFQDVKPDNDCCDDLNGMECGCQENYKQGMCTSAIIVDIGIDECQSTDSKSELSRGRHLPLELEETYLLDLRLFAEDDCRALDFVCNVAACEPDAHMRGVCREGLLKQHARATVGLKKTARHYLFVC
ncbi:hypothetical protein BgiBS90_004431 [Biomphalaria glabrata]|nr:hypothetical protein BgiBS90_004431 [Biomphalaria glabrata]